MSRYDEYLPVAMAEVESNNPKAQWYVRNSSYVSDIYPEFRMPGGGVGRPDMTSSLLQAYDTAIVYTEHRIEDAQRHKRKLQAARAEWLWIKGELG